MKSEQKEILVRNTKDALLKLPQLANDIRYHSHKKSLGGLLTNMANLHVCIGTHAFFVEGNLPGLKQNYHVASKLRLASADMEWGLNLSLTSDFLYPILSDSIEVIQSYELLEPKEFSQQRDKPRLPQFRAHMYQLALRDDYETLKMKIEIAQKNGSKKLATEIDEGKDFFSLLIRKDKKALEELITRNANQWQTILKKGGELGTPITANLIASVAMEEAKLCWKKGIDVEIDHPLIPMDLLPIQSLSSYENEYDFLELGWQNPSNTVFKKIMRMFN